MKVVNYSFNVDGRIGQSVGILAKHSGANTSRVTPPCHLQYGKGA